MGDLWGRKKVWRGNQSFQAAWHTGAPLAPISLAVRLPGWVEGSLTAPVGDAGPAGQTLGSVLTASLEVLYELGALSSTPVRAWGG